MQKQNKSTKTKLALGYLLLIAILLFSVWYVFREMEQLAAPDRYETEFNQKRRVTNTTLNLLYQMEVIGQSLSVGRINDYSSYKAAMEKVQMSLDSLKAIISDSIQIQRIDSITLLLEQKEENMLSLFQTMKEANSDILYQQNIDKIISEQDSLLNQQRVQRKVIVKKNSYTVHKKKKKFFKRLGEVFSPEKQDSTVITNTKQEFVTDTLMQAYNPADTVAGILKTIQTQVNDKRQAVKELLRDKVNNIRYKGQIISSQINQIISDFDEEEASRSLVRLEQEQHIRQHSLYTISTIAIGAVILAALFLILIWHDITKSYHYRQELEKAKQRAEDLLDSREKLMLTVTHDIKAPIGSIMGYIDLLSRLTTEDRQKFYLANMKSSSEHLLKLVKDLLDFHRLDSNKMEINRVNFQPRQLFNEIKTSFEPVAQKKGLQFNYQIDPILQNNFISDPFRIRQIVDNLLSNAFKFTKEGHIDFYISYSNSLLTIIISDTGSGISQEEQEKIFKEFTRLRSAQGEEGFGLGLSITQKLVSLLEGHIEVSSVPKKGSTFRVQLPLFPISDSANNRISSSTVSKSVLNNTPRILIIDDDKIQLELTSAMLHQQNISSVTCETPEELFSFLDNETFDLILTDIQMPAINGFDLLLQLRTSGILQAQTIPVIAVTARSDADKQEFITRGFSGCLHKPFSIDELVSIINGQDIKNQTEQISELSLTALTAFSNDDPVAAKEILSTFISETKKNKAILAKALLEKDVEKISVTAHKILPLFRMIHAERCITHLTILERHRKNILTEDIRSTVEKALTEIQIIIDFAESQK